ncbi:hypothetical protein AOLI_G00324210 [Acnodon oligacanthus]
METRLLPDSAVRLRARRDAERRLQDMKDSSSGNYACQGLGAFSCVFSDEQMPQGSEEVFVETHVYRGTEEDEATLERESVMGVFEEDAVDNDAIPLDLSDGVDVSEEESDFEPEEPGSLIHSLCNWALTFGVSLIAPTALLGLLRFCHPDLPKDTRTLLRTKTDLSIQKRCGGLYYYFGFLSSIKNMLSQATESIVDGFTLKLQRQPPLPLLQHPPCLLESPTLLLKCLYQLSEWHQGESLFFVPLSNGTF